jgi:hypothetical protein
LRRHPWAWLLVASALLGQFVAGSIAAAHHARMLTAATMAAQVCTTAADGRRGEPAIDDRSSAHPCGPLSCPACGLGPAVAPVSPLMLSMPTLCERACIRALPAVAHAHAATPPPARAPPVRA